MKNIAFASAAIHDRHAEDTLTRPRKVQRCLRWSLLPYGRPCRNVCHYCHYRGTQGLPAAQGWRPLPEDRSLGMGKRQPGLCCTALWEGERHREEAFLEHTVSHVWIGWHNSEAPVYFPRLERLCGLPRKHTAPALMGAVQLLSSSCTVYQMIRMQQALPVPHVPTLTKSWRKFTFVPGHAPTLAMRNRPSQGDHLSHQDL